jgi:uncharacterized protein YlaN (UPF0358 family)
MTACDIEMVIVQSIIKRNQKRATSRIKESIKMHLKTLTLTNCPINTSRALL